MRKLFQLSFMLCLVILVSGCKEDWSINPPSAAGEHAAGGYVGIFEDDGASILFAVETAMAGNYDIVVRGRASSDAPGTGRVSNGMENATITFKERSIWSNDTVRIKLTEGLNEIRVSKGAGNGCFYIDYIEISAIESSLSASRLSGMDMMETNQIINKIYCK